jgi:hypothetical protein
VKQFWLPLPATAFEISFHIKFEVFTAVTMKNIVFWDVNGVALVRIDVSEEPSASIIIDSCQPDDGGTKLIQNVRSYKSHTA